MVLWMEVMGTPRAPALSQSTSTRYSGTSSMPLGRTLVRRASFAAMPRSWFRASISFWWPRPPRSRSWKSNPVAVPSSITDGGGKANTRALRILAKTLVARSAMAFTLQIRPIAEVPILELDEDQAIGLGSPGEADPGNRHAGFHGLLFMLLEMARDVGCHRLGLFQGRAGRQHDHGEQDPLILIRHIGRWANAGRGAPPPPRSRHRRLRSAASWRRSVRRS